MKYTMMVKGTAIAKTKGKSTTTREMTTAEGR